MVEVDGVEISSMLDAYMWLRKNDEYESCKIFFDSIDETICIYDGISSTWINDLMEFEEFIS